MAKSIFKYTVKMTNEQGADWSDPFEFKGEGDTFGELITDLAGVIGGHTGEALDAEGLADLINTGLDAWAQQITGGGMFAQRREMSTPESNYDLWILENNIGQEVTVMSAHEAGGRSQVS